MPIIKTASSPLGWLVVFKLSSLTGPLIVRWIGFDCIVVFRVKKSGESSYHPLTNESKLKS